MDRVEELFVPIVATFEEIKNNIDKNISDDTPSKALSFFNLVCSFDFTVTLVITRCVFYLTLPVTQLFKKRTNDILDGLHMIESLKDLLVAIRNNIDHYHNKWYQLALSIVQT